MDGFVRDLRDTLRGLRRSPGFTLVAVISLAVGIGYPETRLATLNIFKNEKVNEL